MTTSKEAEKEHSDFMARMGHTLVEAMKMKSKMLKLGVTEARVNCSRCEGKLHMRLTGRKNHARFWCDGPCKRSLIE